MMMYAWEAIQKAIDSIEDHIKENIETEKLAKEVSLSPFYFQRLFKRLVHKPVQEYIKLRRMACALEVLKDSNKRILEIALDYGFSSHASFTRAFKDVYGMTPEEYRKKQPMLNSFIKPKLAINYVMMEENIPLIVDDIVLEITRKQLSIPESYLGLSAKVDIPIQIPVGGSTGVDIPGELWKRFHQEKEQIANRLDPTITLGMSYLVEPDNGVFTYFAGGRCSQFKGKIDEPFVLQELPAGEYIVCRIEAENFETLVTRALDTANQYLFGTWLPKHHMKTEPFSAEKYETMSDGINAMELWVKPILAE